LGKTTTSSQELTVNGIFDVDDKEIQGIVCWSVFSGKGNEDYSSIRTGKGAEDNSCDLYDPSSKDISSRTFTVSKLSENTDYTIEYYAISIDSRIFSVSSDIQSDSFTTSKSSSGGNGGKNEDEDEEEEEFGDLSSFGFIALLLGILLNL